MGGTVGVLVYFGFGILADVLVTGYTLSATRGFSLLSSLLSFAITILNFYVLANVLTTTALCWYYVIAYAAGNAVGCFAVMEATRRKG